MYCTIARERCIFPVNDHYRRLLLQACRVTYCIYLPKAVYEKENENGRLISQLLAVIPMYQMSLTVMNGTSYPWHSRNVNENEIAYRQIHEKKLHDLAGARTLFFETNEVFSNQSSYKHTPGIRYFEEWSRLRFVNEIEKNG